MPMIAVVIVAVVLVVVLVVVWKAAWRAPEWDEALIVSGLGAMTANRDTTESPGFKIVTGRGTLVLPAGRLRDAAARPMGQMGLVVETLLIQEILSEKSGSDRGL
jgi:hypothetical protein